VNRVVFLVDGFNLYHSLVDVSRDTGGKTSKWLDLKALCSTYTSLAGQIAGARATLERIWYFSAIPTHCSQDRIDRHALYMRCLRAMGVNVQLARFKRKEILCRLCRGVFDRYEEKETDVAMAVGLFEICHSGQADTVVLITGDTDLAPVVRTCKRLFPEQLIFFGFPYLRSSQELKQLAPESFTIKPRAILAHQLPDPFMLPDGTEIQKPPVW
jgi:hypothetical protein